jgi:hypothetical protein
MNGAKISFEAFLKNPTKWTVWTAGGLQRTMNWVSQSGEVWHGGDRTEPSKWFSVAELNRVRGNNQQVMLPVSGLKNDNNNVYIINVNARRKSTGETAPLQMMTLQMRTPGCNHWSVDRPLTALFLNHLTNRTRNFGRSRSVNHSFPHGRYFYTCQTQNEGICSRRKAPADEVMTFHSKNCSNSHAFLSNRG